MSQQRNNNKYHVTIEDCPEEDDIFPQSNQQKAVQIDDFDLGSHINNTNQEANDMMDIDSSYNNISRGNKRQAWDQVDAFEEQARNEKMQNPLAAMVSAKQTARIVKEATRQFSGF